MNTYIGKKYDQMVKKKRGRGRPKEYEEKVIVSISMPLALRECIDEAVEDDFRRDREDQEFRGSRSKAICAAIDSIFG